MESKTYFGEYSLWHWLQLMLKRNIILPDYQRSFVWNHQDIERLIHSFKTGQFIQPVTIARINSIDNGINIILDGQQRLTSILLLALGYFPKKERFKEDMMSAIEDDSVEHDETMVSNDIIDWTFERLLKKEIEQNSLLEIKHRIAIDDNYEILNFKNPDYLMSGEILKKFLENTFLGFSYIVPEEANKDIEQKFFSTLFRNMNYLGQKLSSLESRKSLYYLNEKYKNYFEGRLSDGSEALGGLKIMENVSPRKIDFVRYLSILSQYDERTKAKKIMLGYSAYSSRENFYVDYVSHILGLEQEERTKKFDGFEMSTTFGEEGWEPRFARLKQTIEALKDKMNLDPKYPQAFRSWIDADYWLFGLIYWIVFKDKNIDTETNWTNKINSAIRDKKKNANDSYVKSPNMLGHLRDRIEQSLELIQKHTL